MIEQTENSIFSDSDKAHLHHAGVATIAGMQADRGWVYCAVVLDTYSRRVIGWSIAVRAAYATEIGRTGARRPRPVEQRR